MSDSRVRNEPRYPRVGLIAAVPEPWGGMWLSRQQILTRLSRWFNVVWVDPPVGWRKLWSRGGARRVGLMDPHPPPPHLTVQRQSRFHPRLYRPAWLADRMQRARVGRAMRAAKRMGTTQTILYAWRPEHLAWVAQLRPDCSCYHIADEYSFSTVEHPVPAQERELIERVDEVFIHSPALMEKKGSINPNTTLVTNGVDFEKFSTPCAEPDELRAVPHPRVGYVGRIKTQLDWDILEGVARRRPDVSLVLVGPVGYMGEDLGRFEDLRARRNVFFVPGQPAAAIPAFMQALDVGLLPYKMNDYTKYIYPLKLHEFLAAGIPVVASAIRSLDDFRNVVSVVDAVVDWPDAVAAALDPARNSDVERNRRRAVARGFDWNVISDHIAGRLCARLGLDGTPVPGRESPGNHSNTRYQHS